MSGCLLVYWPACSSLSACVSAGLLVYWLVRSSLSACVSAGLLNGVAIPWHDNILNFHKIIANVGSIAVAGRWEDHYKPHNHRLGSKI